MYRLSNIARTSSSSSSSPTSSFFSSSHQPFSSHRLFAMESSSDRPNKNAKPQSRSPLSSWSSSMSPSFFSTWSSSFHIFLLTIVSCFQCFHRASLRWSLYTLLFYFHFWIDPCTASATKSSLDNSNARSTALYSLNRTFEQNVTETSPKLKSHHNEIGRSIDRNTFYSNLERGNMSLLWTRNGKPLNMDDLLVKTSSSDHDEISDSEIIAAAEAAAAAASAVEADGSSADTGGGPPAAGYSQVMLTFAKILYGVVCVVGLCGNTLVIYVVLRFSKMQTVTNMYILNLALADEMFLVGLPFLIMTLNYRYWAFGWLMCKVYMTITSINQFTSSLLLTVMSADRYIAVCHPIASPRYRTPFIAKIICLSVWTLSAYLMIPIFIFADAQTHGNSISCNIYWPELDAMNGQRAFTLYSFTLGFFIPLLLILLFYFLIICKLRSISSKHRSREKRKTHRKVTYLVLTVITAYVGCWLPYWIGQVYITFLPPAHRHTDLSVTLILLAGCLSYTNSAANPFFYGFLSENFKKSFAKAFTCSGQEVNAQLHAENSVFPGAAHSGRHSMAHTTHHDGGQSGSSSRKGAGGDDAGFSGSTRLSSCQPQNLTGSRLSIITPIHLEDGNSSNSNVKFGSGMLGPMIDGGDNRQRSLNQRSRRSSDDWSDEDEDEPEEEELVEMEAIEKPNTNCFKDSAPDTIASATSRLFGRWGNTCKNPTSSPTIQNHNLRQDLMTSTITDLTTSGNIMGTTTVQIQTGETIKCLKSPTLDMNCNLSEPNGKQISTTAITDLPDSPS